MVRGKYAAKANGQRAQVAQNTASALRAQIDEMRREHAAEVVALKARVAALEGQLLREVRNLSNAEIHRAKQEAAERLRVEREAHRQQAIEVCRMAVEIRDALWRESEPMPEFGNLYDYIVEHVGVSPRELEEGLVGAGVDKVSRRARRQTIGEFRNMNAGIPTVRLGRPEC